MIHWDAHICLPLHPQASFAPIDQLKAAGPNYVSINVGMDMNTVSQIMSVIAGYRQTIAAHPETYVLVDSVAAIERARHADQMAIGFDLEGAMPLLSQPDMVALYASLGVRQIRRAPAPAAPRRRTGLNATWSPHGQSGQRRGHADGLFTHRSSVQPGDHGSVRTPGGLQPCQSVCLGGTWPQRHR